MNRATTAVINLDHLAFNVRQLLKKTLPKQKLMAVIKADAYGHGAKAVFKHLCKRGIQNFAVATIDEALELRKIDSTSSILVLGGFLKGNLDLFIEHRLEACVHSWQDFYELIENPQKANQIKLHVKLDTGMGRLGFVKHDLPKLTSLLEKHHLPLFALMSHFARADEINDSYIQTQIQNFEWMKASLPKAYQNTPTHLVNSAGLIAGLFPNANMVRPGLALYGLYSHKDMQANIELKPVMRFQTQILTIKQMPAGSKISYGSTFTAKRDSRIAILPVGYADGYPRLLSNKAFVGIKGKRYPIVGRVCMDLMMIDVTDNSQMNAGDTVVLWGDAKTDGVGVDELAGLTNTISYELVCGVGKRVGRIYEARD